jgi:hypothetical protein
MNHGEVEALLGPPRSRSNMAFEWGTAQIWHYRHIMVTFRDGKVTGWNIG